MNCIHKKLWIAWSKLRFLRLPVERRVRLEVTTDGRHLTFILVSLYEAGYGVQVVGSPAVFRELICLRKSAPIPFVIGGGERGAGISISDKSGFNHGGHRGGKKVLLDYDYFSGLTTKSTKERETGKIIEPRMTRIYTDGQQGDAQGTCAGDAFSNPSTSELARASENTSLTRSASVPAGAFFADNVEIESAGGNQLADSIEFLEGQSQAGLQMDNQKGPTIRTANDPTAPGEYSSSVLIRDIRGKNSSSPATSYSPLATALRAPYFMHPSVYHRGLHKRRSPITALDARSSTLDSAAKQRRRFRLAFFGTHDREFYTKHYHFPGMNRFEILEVFLQKFADRITPLRGFPRDWDSCEMAVSIDSRGGDRKGKSFLSQDHYFEALHECDFVLSPPGWCMPVSHNLIEAMFCGAIPITNAGSFMAEPLKDGETYVEFHDAEGLVSVIDRVLAMDSGEVSRMQEAVRDYYERFLEPEAFVENAIRSNSTRISVNAEEKSVPLVCKKFHWSPELK